MDAQWIWAGLESMFTLQVMTPAQSKECLPRHNTCASNTTSVCKDATSVYKYIVEMLTPQIRNGQTIDTHSDTGQSDVRGYSSCTEQPPSLTCS